MGFATSGIVGAAFDQTHATAQFAIGTTALGSDGTEYMYVLAGSAITQYYCVGIDENFSAAHLSNTTGAGAHKVGFPQVAIASGEYGWVATRGSNINVKVRASCAADVALYTTASAGRLDDTVGGSGLTIQGVVLVVAASASTSAANTVRECLATFPHLVEP